MTGQRAGRRPKRPVEGQRNQVGLSLTAEMKARLDREAFRQGRPLAAEVEARLQDSFTRQDLLSETMTLAFGPQTAALLQMIGHTLEIMSAARALGSSRPWDSPPMDGSNWLDDRDYYDAARAAIGAILDALQPPHDFPVDDMPWASGNPGPEGFGRAMGARFLEHLAEADTPRWRAIRDGLGALASSKPEGKSK